MKSSVGSNPTSATKYAQVVERYTRDTQNVVLARGCGFESHLGHKNLTHSVVASTSDSGSDNGGSSPPGSTILGMWRNWLDAIVLGTIGLSSCGFDSHHPHKQIEVVRC